MKTSAKRTSAFAIIVLMLLANLSCTKDFIHPKIITRNVFTGMMNIKSMNSDSTINKNVGTTISSIHADSLPR